MMTHDESAEKAINYIRDYAKEFAKAKAERVYLEQYRKTKKALLIIQAPDNFKTMLEKESYAYAHDEYQELLRGLQMAVEIEEKLRFEMQAANLRFEQWRTMQANNRAEFKQYGN